MEFEITDKIPLKDKNSILNGLVKYNSSKLSNLEPVELGVYYKVDGKVKAGLIGNTHGNWLQINILWVSDELRGYGVGSKLLAAAEQEALNRNCKYSILYTSEFQAPGFYVKYGYQEAFVLENFPLTGQRYYYIKNLV